MKRKIGKGNGMGVRIIKWCFRDLYSFLHYYSVLRKSLKSTFIFLVFTLASDGF